MNIPNNVAGSQNDYVKQEKKGTEEYELCDSIYIKSRPRPNTFVVFEARKDICLCWGGDLPRKAFEGIFWGGGYTCECSCQNSWNRVLKTCALYCM